MSSKSKSADSLNAKELIFVKEYQKHGNSSKAAIAAGYAKNSAGVTGCRMLKKAKIANAISKDKKERCERLEIETDAVLESVKEIVERCMQIKPVIGPFGIPVMVVTRDGERTAAYTFDAKNALKGLELLGKHVGAFPNKVEHSGPGGGPVPVSNMTDTDLEKFLNEAS